MSRRGCVIQLSKVIRKNIIYLSRLRAVSCIAVVVLHTFFAFDSCAHSLSQHTAMITGRNLMSWAVPCFVMVSGTLLLAPERKTDFRKLFGQYILRMVLALLIFTVIFSVFDSVISPNSLNGSLFGDIMSDIFLGTGWKHMWYLYLMIAIYLLLPFYKMITKNADKNELIYLLVIYLVFMSAIPVYTAFSGKVPAFYICVSTIYPMYLFAGYIIHNKMIKMNFIVSVVCIAVFSAVITLMTSITCYSKNTAFDSLLSNYGFPITVLGSFGMFSLFKSSEKQNWKIVDKVLSGIDKCSFGIYLIHMAVLRVIFSFVKFNPFENGNGGVFTVILISLGVFAVSYVVTFVLRLIPFVKKLI